MVIRSIRNEIICDYKDECRRYNCNSRTSECLGCRHNKWKNKQELKKDYYEPKISKLVFNIIIGLLMIIFILLVNCYI